MLQILDNKEFIEHLGYHLIRRLCEKQSSCAVYQALAKKANLKDYVVVKIPNGGNSFWDPRKHLIREKELLEKFYGSEGIPSLIDFYDESDGMALIKDYVHGRPMYFGQRITDTKSQCIIEEAVRTLHDSDFARFELVPANVVLSNGIPFLIDLGSAVSLQNWEVSVSNFCKFVDSDLKALEKLCD